MPFDPTKPADNSPNSSAEMRGQLTSLKSLIDATPGLTDVVIDGVTTLPPGEAATAEAVVTGTVLHLTFGIPQGSEGPQGNPGTDGGQGPPGNDGQNGQGGAPGEVSLAQLAAAINDTSGNSNAVTTMDNPFVNDPPTQADMELMRGKYNELVLALRRA